MLRITLPVELWDEGKQEFVYLPGQTLELEHSLASLSKWESKWHKPFLFKKEKTDEELLDYVKCMTLTPNVDPTVYYRLTPANYSDIEKYIGNPMTATTFSDNQNRKHSREIITAEIIYYWMVALNIQFEPCQHWHLNRLITLIRVCNLKNTPPKKKKGSAETASKYARLNAARKKQSRPKG